MKFLGNILATVIGIFIFFMLLFFSLLFFSAIAGSSSEVVKVEENSVIELDLSQVVTDYAGKFNYEKMPFLNDADKHDGVTDIVKAIENAKTDDNIKGISILNSNSMLGMAQSKDVRNALEDFKKSGKFVYAYSNIFSQKEYYLNSVANTIYLNPVGELDFKGFSSEVMFYKDFEEKSGLKVEVIRHGKYKSAVEPFLENKMSDANREQISSLLNSIWATVVSDISVSRKIPVEKLNAIANGLLARTPALAKAEKLIDVVAYEDVYHDAIRQKLKVEKDEDYNSISIVDYAENVATTGSNTTADESIAVIYAQGNILNGEGDVDYIGEGSMRRSLIEARKDENIKAIVLRVDSPGGNALTSDLIWREIELTKKVKPVVVSMGNYAASGGYYIACNANRIFAEKNTITGSIGVFGMLPNFSVAATKYGLNTELVKTHENASNYSPFLPLDTNFKAFAQESVEQIYTTFVARVAAGRKMTVAQVDSLAQGRVWSGSDALKNGLVDEIGGLNSAKKYAASLAKIKEYSTINYPIYEKDFDEILGNLGLFSSKTKMIQEEIGEENYQIIQKIKRATLQKGAQAVMLYDIKIQ